jgi:hypothetical protein
MNQNNRGDDDGGGAEDQDAPAVDPNEGVCARFLRVWNGSPETNNPDPDADAAAAAAVKVAMLLVEIASEHQGDLGHLAFHPNLRVSLFGTTRTRWRIHFFERLLSSNPRLRSLQCPESGVTLLHLALYGGADLPLVRILASNEVTRLQDLEGRTPLYLACSRRGSERDGLASLQEFLLETDPWAARIEDHKGQLPLHLACQQNPLHPVVQRLIHEFPEALSHRHSGGVTPVLGAFWFDPSLISGDAAADDEPNDEDEEPHGLELVSLEVGNLLKSWVRRYPSSVQCFNRRNLETALACFCRHPYGDDPELCRMLIDAYPIALVMAPAMLLFPHASGASLPTPEEIARRYGRSPLV